MDFCCIPGTVLYCSNCTRIILQSHHLHLQTVLQCTLLLHTDIKNSGRFLSLLHESPLCVMTDEFITVLFTLRSPVMMTGT